MSASDSSKSHFSRPLRVRLEGEEVVIEWSTPEEGTPPDYKVEHQTPHPSSSDPVHPAVPPSGNAYRYSTHLLSPGKHRFRIQQDAPRPEQPRQGLDRFQVHAQIHDYYRMTVIYPTDEVQEAVFSFMPLVGQYAAVDIFRSDGETIAHLHEGFLQARKTYGFSLVTEDLPAGTYLFVVAGTAYTAAHRLTLPPI